MGIKWWLLFIAQLVFALELNAFGIGASPALIRFKKIPLGKELTATERIVVNNPNPYGNWYKFRMQKTTEHPFFEPIPSLTWISISQESVYAPAESSSDGVSIKVLVPEDYRYYNRHYAGTISVFASSGSGISAGIAIIIEIETEPLYSYPDSVKDYAPLFPTFSCVGAVDSFTIYNGETQPTVYQFSLSRRLGMDDSLNSSPMYEPHFFFLVPVDALGMRAREKRQVYGIFRWNWGGEMYVTMTSRDKHEKTFIKLENCR